MKKQIRMCVVNRALVEDIEPLVGSQHDIMRRLGISWNSWIKIAGGCPIRLSVGQRLRARVVETAGSIPSFRKKYPSNVAADGIDRVALEAGFLRPVFMPSKAMEPYISELRSVRRARALEASYT